MSFYIYDLEDDSEREKIIDNIVIIRNGDNPISNENIILKADKHDDVICMYDKLVNSLLDEVGIYYFRCKKSRRLYKDVIKEKKSI